jgi:hypothetical protein
LINFEFKDVGATVVGEMEFDFGRAILWRNFEKLIFGGLHEKHAVQRGIWVPTQHLLWDQGKARKTLIELAGRRTFRLQPTSSQQSGIEYANPNIASLSVRLLYYKIRIQFFTDVLYSYNLDKQHTVYNTWETKLMPNMKARKRMFIFILFQ